MILKTLGLSWIVCLLQIGEQLGYKDPLCRYHYHYEAKSWASAREICNRTGKTLLIIDNEDELRNITNEIIPHVRNVATGNNFNLKISPTLWIGLHQETNPVRLLWDNCNQFTVEPSQWNPESTEGCVILNTTNTTYELRSCNDTHSFICEDQTEEDGECFDVVVVENQSDIEKIPEAIGRDGSQDTGSCPEICYKYQKCAAYTSDINHCYRHFYGGAYATRGSTRKPFNIYIKNIFIRNDVSNQATPVISDYYCPKPSSSSVVHTSTSFSSEISHTSSSFYQTTSVSYSSLESSIAIEPSSAISSFSSSSPSSAAATASHVIEGSTSSTCYCSCTVSLASSSITSAELQAKIEQMQTELTVNKKETSSYKRKLTSAPDDRISAKSIGYVGVVILTIVTGLVVCIDLPTIMKDSMAFFKRCRNCCCKK